MLNNIEERNQFSALKAKNQFGHLLDLAQASPVEITKHGRRFAYVLSASEYERLRELEDRAWAKAAQKEIDKNYEFTLFFFYYVFSNLTNKRHYCSSYRVIILICYSKRC